MAANGDNDERVCPLEAADLGMKTATCMVQPLKLEAKGKVG